MNAEFSHSDGSWSIVSVSPTAELSGASSERMSDPGIPNSLQPAVQRRIERDNLDELIADFDKRNGPADAAAVAAKHAELTRAG
ncbi:hypothetical protein [Nocardia sp. NPDC019395]|uniref:hypothetical protein n=1 Tax=Nocardia sp. NPDC019395 TaxID=3154686 RepID=UPI0033D0B719